jgi:hypothetical protein
MLRIASCSQACQFSAVYTNFHTVFSGVTKRLLP